MFEMIDSEKIFNLFKDTSKKEILDLKDTLEFKLGMFVKLILNHNNCNLGFFNLIKRISNNDFDINEIKEAGIFYVFNSSYDYIKNLDLNNKKNLKLIKNNFNKDLILTLNLAIKFFETYEEYEKCAFLKKILDIKDLSL